MELQVSVVLPRDDPMYESAPDIYFDAGESALRWTGLALAAANQSEPARILDYACGYGRVLRWLRVGYPEASIMAADIFDSMPAFCQQTLGADEAVVLPRDPSDLNLGTFDLIWVGSLLSHTDAAAWRTFLTFFKRSLTWRGIAVFTTHGQSLVNDGLRTGTNKVRFSEDQLEQVLRDYDDTGFGYAATVTPDHGDCVASPEWIAAEVREAGLQIVLFSEEAWLGQDLIAVRLPRAAR